MAHGECVPAGTYKVKCHECGTEYTQDVRSSVNQYEVCGYCGGEATFTPIDGSSLHEEKEG